MCLPICSVGEGGKYSTQWTAKFGELGGCIIDAVLHALDVVVGGYHSVALVVSSSSVRWLAEGNTVVSSVVASCYTHEQLQ